MSIITLLSDFGYKDPYVAEMKAVILSINPQVNIVDVSHEIEKYNINMGAFFLASIVPFFPEGTIHVVVVDPGVGTKRRAIIIETHRGYLIGPDNGVLMLSAVREKIKNVFSIDNPKYARSEISNTFHGRDIFAPAAANLAKGINVNDFGRKVKDFIFPNLAKSYVKDGKLVGVVIHIDGFGNIITNISVEDLESYGIHESNQLEILLGGRIFTLMLHSTYSKVPVGSPLALIGSRNFLEFAVNQGDASHFFGSKIQDLITISKL